MGEILILVTYEIRFGLSFAMIRTGNGSLFYPVQGRDVDMDYKTYPFVYDNKIRQAVAVALYALITTLVLAIITVMGVMLWLVLAPTIFKRRSGGKFGL